MRAVFADTCYWIALLNPKDQTHEVAIRVSKGLADCRILTTEEVLTELLDYFGERGSYFRSASRKLVQRMQVDRSIHILPVEEATAMQHAYKPTLYEQLEALPEGLTGVILNGQ
jgi:predicted nucleic acid-binding protein